MAGRAPRMGDGRKGNTKGRARDGSGRAGRREGTKGPREGIKGRRERKELKGGMQEYGPPFEGRNVRQGHDSFVEDTNNHSIS